MLNEILEMFDGSNLRIFFDGTTGAGGHAEALLKSHPEIETYIACDRDPKAIELAKERLKPWEDKMVWIQGNFAHLDEYLDERNIHEVDGFFLI